MIHLGFVNWGKFFFFFFFVVFEDLRSIGVVAEPLAWIVCAKWELDGPCERLRRF